jgi:predicted transcriptional regulator
MKTLSINQFDKKDEEIVDALISFGMSKPAARMIAYIQQVNEATSIELEMGAGLRQLEKQQQRAADEAQAIIERLKELGK